MIFCLLFTLSNSSYYPRLKDASIRHYQRTTSDESEKRKLKLIKTMFNAETKQHIKCDPNHYNYVSLLLKEMNSETTPFSRRKTISNEIDKDYESWKANRMRIRIKIINKTIYVSKLKRDIEGYRTGLILYLYELQLKYSNYLPNTDFVWYYHDFKMKWDKFNNYNWFLNDTIPYFWSDANLVNHAPYNNIFLFLLSRSFLKYRYFADQLNSTKYQDLITGSGHTKFVNDYLQYKEIDSMSNSALFQFEHKSINKVLFRGGRERHSSFGIRDALFDILYSDWIYKEITAHYFDVSSEPNKSLDMRAQLEYKFIAVLDGHSVRDGFFYQLNLGSVLLKQLSSFYEWFYYDLVNNVHYVLFENIMHLISLGVNMVDSVTRTHHQRDVQRNELEFMIDQNMTHWNEQKLQRISENAKQFAKHYLLNDDAIDCFVIHMLQIYNHYIFDADSVVLNDNDIQELFNLREIPNKSEQELKSVGIGPS